MHKLILSDELIYKGRFYSYVKRKIQKPCGNSYDYECIHQESNDGLGGVEIIPILRKNGRDYLIVTQNFRYAVGHWILEFPGGMIEKGEEAEVCAIRELKEETGFQATRILYSGKPMNVDPWKSNDVY